MPVRQNYRPITHIIYEAFLQSAEIRTCVKPDRVNVFNEHGQYWVTVDDTYYQADDTESSRIFSVAEANTPSGYTFEEV